jgi:hypothetical protein
MLRLGFVISMIELDDYNEVRECVYKNEHYSVRDNGAVMRHRRIGMMVTLLLMFA